jgi:hypothetical protein
MQNLDSFIAEHVTKSLINCYILMFDMEQFDKMKI